MNLDEIFEDVNPNAIFKKAVPGYQDLEDDNSQLQKSNVRKTRLTLLQINKMRQMNDVRNYEYKQKLGVIQDQYGPGASGGEDDLDF